MAERPERKLPPRWAKGNTLNNSNAPVSVAFHAGKGTAWVVRDLRSGIYAFDMDLFIARNKLNHMREQDPNTHEANVDNDNNTLRSMMKKFSDGSTVVIFAGLKQLPYMTSVNFVEGQWHAECSFNSYNLPVSMSVDAKSRDVALGELACMLVDTISTIPV